MMRFAISVFAMLVSATDLLAQPITVLCYPDEAFAMIWGRLSVTIDENARHVHVEAEKLLPGVRADYQDDAHSAIFTGVIYEWMPNGVVSQFVKFKPDIIELGWYDEVGLIEHYSWLSGDVLRNPTKKCIWHRALVIELA